jgi:hypothetical protein
LFDAFDWACVACCWAFVGSEAYALTGLSVDYSVLDPAEVASIEAVKLIIVYVSSRFATPEINRFFVDRYVGGWLAALVVECGFHWLLPDCRGYDCIYFSSFGSKIKNLTLMQDRNMMKNQ